MPYTVTGTKLVLSVDLFLEPFTRVIGVATGATRALFEPAALGRLLTYAEPVLPTVVDVLGGGPVGLFTTRMAIRIVRKALLENTEPGTTERDAAKAEFVSLNRELVVRNWELVVRNRELGGLERGHTL